MSLRHSHTDEFKGVKSYRFGSSTTNTVSLVEVLEHDALINCYFDCYLLLGVLSSLLSEDRKLVGTIKKFCD